MDAAMKALAEPNRRRILELVAGRERSAGEIAERFAISRPAVSQHLTVLKRAGLVAERRNGVSRLYRSRRQGFAQARWFIDGCWDDRIVPDRPALEQPVPNLLAVSQRVSVQRDLAIHAPPDAIWELLTNPDEAVRWMGVDASFDLTVGGHYRNEIVPGSVATGEFLDISEPQHLTHTWGWEGDAGDAVPAGSTIVDVELVATTSGTAVRVTHHDLPNVDAAGSHSNGWGHYLPRLAIAASGRSPGPDPWATDPHQLRQGLERQTPISPAPHKETP